MMRAGRSAYWWRLERKATDPLPHTHTHTNAPAVYWHLLFPRLETGVSAHLISGHLLLKCVHLRVKKKLDLEMCFYSDSLVILLLVISFNPLFYSCAEPRHAESVPLFIDASWHYKRSIYILFCSIRPVQFSRWDIKSKYCVKISTSCWNSRLFDFQSLQRILVANELKSEEWPIYLGDIFLYFVQTLGNPQHLRNSIFLFKLNIQANLFLSLFSCLFILQS